MEEELKPSSILERKITKRGNVAETLVLILWKDKPISEATWEFLSDMRLRFPSASLWTSNFSEEGDVTGAATSLGFRRGEKRDKTESKESCYSVDVSREMGSTVIPTELKGVMGTDQGLDRK